MKMMLQSIAIAILLSVCIIPFAGALDNNNVNIVYKNIMIDGVSHCAQVSVKNGMEDVLIVNSSLCSKFAPVNNQNINGNNGQ